MDESPQQADWRRWLEEHAPKFLLFARQQARSEADAQDLVQEALVEACHRQNDDRPPPPALVFATVRRRAIDLASAAVLLVMGLLLLTNKLTILAAGISQLVPSWPSPTL